MKATSTVQIKTYLQLNEKEVAWLKKLLETPWQGAQPQEDREMRDQFLKALEMADSL